MSRDNPSRVRSLAPLVATVFLLGCDQLTSTPNNKPTKTVTTKENRAPVHRFVLTRNESDVAFDTQTGQICRTWEWTPIGKAPKADPETGNSPQRKFGEFAPTCISLYQQYPSATNPQSESIPAE